MEGAPRIPMLASDVKCPMTTLDFGPTVKEVRKRASYVGMNMNPYVCAQYIVTHYGEDPSKYDAALRELNELREVRRQRLLRVLYSV